MSERAADTTPWVLETTKAISRGDRAAMAAFYEAWFDRCYGLARSITKRDESFCLDVVQETMLRVIRSLRPLSNEAELSAWMVRACHSAALDLLRKESRRARRESSRGSAGAEPTEATDERISWIVERLRELPAGDGALVALRVTQNRTLDSVGAAAGISADAAHGRLRRAVARLKRLVKEGGHER